MEKLTITGGKKLKGSVSVSGAKNVALKAIVAATLTDEEVIIKNIPLINDVMIMTEIIKELGGEVEFRDHILKVRVKNFKQDRIFLDKAAEVRTSFMFLVPILARMGRAIIPNPGGCRIGARPIDRIVEGLNKMGAEVEYLSKDGYFHATFQSKRKRFKGTTYKFQKTTHTGTETLLLAAVLAEGKTILENAAEEPEIDELIGFLNSMGAKIKRVSPRTIEIVGVETLHGATFNIGFDRNEVVTFAVAAILTEGDVTIKGINRNGLFEFLEMLDKTGAGYEETKTGMRFFYKGPLSSTNVETRPYPGFMTDWQGPWAVLMTKANGDSIIHETVYENRFTYVRELRKMGVKMSLFNPEVKNPEKIYNFNIQDVKKGYYHAAKIKGPRSLHNGVVSVTDLRAGATLVLAALFATGESIIFDIEHLDRGYEQFEKRLESLGAKIKRSSID